MAKNKRQLKKQEQKAALKALSSVVDSGTITELMFTKVMNDYTEKKESGIDNQTLQTDTSISKMYENTISSLNSINESIRAVTKTFNKLTGAITEKISDRLEERRLLEYQQEEAQMEAVPVRKPKPTATGEKEKPTGDVIKDFFTNPAVVAAFSGLVYLFLPKEIKEKISNFFTGFKDGLGEVTGEFDTFKTALMVAGAGLATYLGVSVLKSVTEGIASTLALIGKAKKGLGVLGRGAQKVLGSKAGMAAAAVGGGAAVGIMASDLGDKEEKPKAVPEQKPPVAGPGQPSVQPAPSTPTITPESKPVLGGGITPQAKGITGLKVPEGTVKDAIDQASEKVGVDKSIMYAVAKQESGFNPNAKAGTSSATGLFQFISGTWQNMVSRFGRAYPELNKGPTDPYASATAGALYIKENSDLLKKRNIPVNGTTIYASHFLGPNGAAKLLTADPNANAAELLPQAASANKSIFYNKDGSPASVKDVIGFLYKKVGAVAEQYASLGGAKGITPPSQVAMTTATPITQTPSTGINIAMASETMEDTARGVGGGGGIINNNIDNSRRIQEKTGLKPPPPIPSPIASRGILDFGIKHSTAYAG